MSAIQYVQRLSSRTRRLRLPLLLGCVLMFSVAASCPYIPRPAQGPKTLNVPYHAQSYNWGCTYACIQMAYHFQSGGPTTALTQSAIQDWFRLNDPNYQPNSGPGPTWFANGASYYLNRTIVADLYLGTSGTHQAVADQENNVGVNVPTMVVVNPLNPSAIYHAVVVEGTSWHELNDAIRRASVNYMYIKDPLGSRDGSSIPLGDWLHYRMALQIPQCAQRPCAYNIQPAGQLNRGKSGLEAFDAEGGTYYGAPPPNPTGRYKYDGNGNCYWEPNDSGPNQCAGGGPTGRYKYDGNGNCYWEPNDSGPDQCQPELARRRNHGFGPSVSKWLRTSKPALSLTAGPSAASLVGRRSSVGSTTQQQGGGQRTVLRSSEVDKAIADGIFIPNPFTKKPDEILANIGAAARQSHLDRFPELKTFGTPAPRVKAQRILSVRSLDPMYGPDYYVVDVADLSGRPYAHVAISKAGVMREVEDIRTSAMRGAVDVNDAKKLVAEQLKLTVSDVEYVFAFSIAEGSSSIVRPLAAVRSVTGTVYVNAKGEAFAEAGSDLARAMSQERDDDEATSPSNFLRLRKIHNEQ